MAVIVALSNKPNDILAAKNAASTGDVIAVRVKK